MAKIYDIVQDPILGKWHIDGENGRVVYSASLTEEEARLLYEKELQNGN